MVPTPCPSSVYGLYDNDLLVVVLGAGNAPTYSGVGSAHVQVTVSATQFTVTYNGCAPVARPCF